MSSTACVPTVLPCMLVDATLFAACTQPEAVFRVAVRLLREELQLLQEPGSYVGEVIKVRVGTSSSTGVLPTYCVQQMCLHLRAQGHKV